MKNDPTELQRVLAEMAVLIERNAEPNQRLYTLFFQNPELSFKLVDLINNLEDSQVEADPPIYSACVFSLDICVAQLQAGAEAKNKISSKVLVQLMNHLAAAINMQKHGLSFWLPVLNAFYEVHVELTDELKDAYFNLASQEEELLEDIDPVDHLETIRDLILDLSDLTIFDIAENFFAQSYAMPADFFADLIVDLYNIPEGNEIALLTLLHPKAEVRDVVVSVFEQIIDKILLSSAALTRLQIIKYWYPESYRPYFDKWLKIQRKKGVVFEKEPKPAKMNISATEIDGTGSQGTFITVKDGRKYKLCGLLFNYEVGIKDAWITPSITSKEVKEYHSQAFDDSVTLREVDVEYLRSMVEHFLAVSIEQGEVPSLHFLEIQELIGLRLRPNRMELDSVFDQLSVQIVPFTEEAIAASLQRSKSWLKSKSFTESWYVESPLIDKIVNHNSSFVDGVKVCRLEDAIDDVFKDEMENQRDKWAFHFLWVALWVMAKAKKTEKIWQDSFLIAYSIRQGMPLRKIPVMEEICRQTVINSVETMRERKTHLNKE